MLRLLLLSHVAAPVAAAATFYVSSSAGDDSASGTTPDQAWATLGKAGEAVSGHNGSCTLLLSRDVQWLNDPLTITSSYKVSVGAYGATSLPQPLLQHSRSLTDEVSPCVGIKAPSVSVSDLHFSGCSRGLVLAGGRSAVEAVADAEVRSNVFLDIRTPFLRYTPPNPAWASAITLDGGFFRNLTVRNNVAVRIDTFFTSRATTDTMDLDSNTVQQCSGNCYSMGSGVGLTLRNSVFLRDTSTRLFMYGTTDVIVGGLKGSNSLIDNDFLARGEYQGGPDGCAFDFETAATGFVVKGNGFSQSWGAGIMIFGHETTSKNISLTNNLFDRCGCVQNRGDRGGVAVMCPNKNKPSGDLSQNTFFTLPGCPAINPAFKGCDSELVQTGNQIVDYTSEGAAKLVDIPQLSFNPPSPKDKDTSGVFNVIAVTTTPGATIRYTLDGSRPTATSPVMPVKGLNLPWPGPVVNVNVRGFKDGLTSSITNGALVELNYVLGRMAPGPLGPGGHKVGGFAGSVDVV
eukprot:Hpha_TRINITY_DN5423_c0_g1::TRINITY_DN5423_c0_g1_i1::g.192524::m.192524